ncbi:long-chain-fatty-acid--CoA ligase [Pseudovibrio exalbescens]|uniref:long-chain-fatty-acid--CoA ligase n=1 Tax=Pseudovibrio exalbescens TaxID=197461 RepID=UPI002365FB4D|nr:long-chain-fatty-acid--CoA ligase [Pseudovibrio exalbescens]MDD7911179.1 long-chain-fatty-acid--CoA ligase [Pseudovibrio exalbescens]
MLGLMQDWPLVCSKLIDHAALNFPNREFVTRSVEGDITRVNYAQLRARSLQLAKRLDQSGVKMGDRIATLAWNTSRHVEAWFGIMGVGAIYHTVNPRLFPEQIAWIINHAEDRMIFVDLTFVPLVEAIWDKLNTVEKVVVLTDDAHMPATDLPAVAYESFIAAADSDFRWLELDENAAAGLCYTSGTTGNPKGVLYSHRSNILHAMTGCLPDMMGLGSRDRILPVVPMFHANGWALPFVAALNGSGMVLPGARMDGEAIWELLDSEKVTFTAAVPTVWLMLLQYLEKSGKELLHLERVLIGGAACPRTIMEAFENKYGVHVMHAWGMTEMSPLGTICSIKPELAHLEGDARLDLQEKQGHAPFGVEMKITDDEGNRQPWDGKTYGKLMVRGPAITKSYFKGEGGNPLDDEGYFDTGDVAHIDEYGYMQITDRSKDVIKSGGEWISSIELENLAVGHPQVAEAAVIGIHHPKWDERPLLVIVPKQGEEIAKDSIFSFMEGKIAKWWMPDDVVFVEELPHTATGKIKKTALREQFREYELPTV